MMYQHLTPDYQEKVLERWTPVLECGDEIMSEQVQLATALVLENAQREFDRFSEASSGAMGTGSPVQGGNQGFGAGDARMPQVVIPITRRIFPNMFAHEVAGVQPMNGPVGFAYAIRSVYGNNSGGTANIDNVNTEIGYNTIVENHTGKGEALTASTQQRAVGGGSFDENAGVGDLTPVSSLGAADITGDTEQVSDYWRAFAGNNTSIATAADLASAEWWAIESDMPMAEISMEKSVVTANSRKLAAHWSLELAEDMMNMNGIDVDAEMVNTLSYEIQQEIDRELLSEMNRSAILAGNASTWTPAKSDGRWQLERISTFYTAVLDRSQDIAINTRRGSATFAVSAPKVVTLFQRIADFTGDTAGGNVNTGGSIGVAKVGATSTGLQVYRDTFAGGNYVLLGHKGINSYDAGVIYCPYIPVQLMRSAGQENFSPRIGVRTRYGILPNMFGSGNYYQFIKLDGLTDEVLASGNGVFTF